MSVPGARFLSADARWTFLDKRRDAPVFPRHDGAEGPSVLDALLAAAPEAADLLVPDGFAGGILHRLDTGTSGLVIAARTAADFELGRALFAGGSLVKRYLFLTARDVAWNDHRVDALLAHDARDRRKMVWQRGQDTPHRGRWYPAQTGLRRLGRADGLQVWEASIHSGVTHQIRVHAAAVGLALHGDRLYGGGAGDGHFYLHHRCVDGWPGGTPEVSVPADWPELGP